MIYGSLLTLFHTSTPKPQRPEGFLEGNIAAFLETEKDEAGKKLDKITEDNSELFDNNADAYQDSHKTVAFDANGRCVCERERYA